MTENTNGIQISDNFVFSNRLHVLDSWYVCDCFIKSVMLMCVIVLSNQLC